MSNKNQSKSKSPSATERAENDNSQYVTLGVVRELLQVQERMFKSFIESISNNLTKRVDDLVDQVSSLKASLEFSQGNIQDHSIKLSAIDRDFNNVFTDVKDLQASGEKVLPKSTYLENQSRRNNLRIEGIPEDINETWEKTEEKVKDVLVNKLHLDFTPRMERAHRTGPSRNSNGGPRSKPKTVVCRLYDWKEKELILSKAKKIKPIGIFVNEDPAEETIKKRKELLPKLKEAREQGKIAYFSLDKLIIKNRSRPPFNTGEFSFPQPSNDFQT